MEIVLVQGHCPVEEAQSSHPWWWQQAPPWRPCFWNVVAGMNAILEPLGAGGVQSEF